MQMPQCVSLTSPCLASVLRRVAVILAACVIMVVFSACDDSDGNLNGDLAVYGNGVRIESGHHSPNAADGTYFGEAKAGDDETLVVRNFTVRNDSSQGIAFLAEQPRVRLQNGDAEEFIVLQDLPETLAANGEFIVRIGFTPNLVGERTTVVSIPYWHNQTEKEFTARIGGTGISLGHLQVRGENGEIISHNVSNLSRELGTDFGEAPNDGSDASVSTFSLHNTATSGVLEITEVRIAGSDSRDFLVYQQPEEGIPHGSSMDLTIHFLIYQDPDQQEEVLGDRWAHVEIFSSDRTLPLYRFFVVGAAVAPEATDAPTADF